MTSAEQDGISCHDHVAMFSGSGIPSATELRAMIAEMIPAGMQIHVQDDVPTISNRVFISRDKDHKPTEIELWNARVDDAKAERKMRRSMK